MATAMALTKLALHRLTLVAAVVIGGAVWAMAWPWLTPPGAASGGGSLVWAQGGLPAALAVTVLLGLPAVLLAAVCAAMMRWTTGVLALAVALGFLAVASGSLDPLIWTRTQQATADAGATTHALRSMYLGLAGESLLWCAIVLGAAAAMHALAGRLRRVLPVSWTEPELQEDQQPWAFALPRNINDWQAAGVTLVVGTIVTWLLLRGVAPGQVIGAMLLGFGAGAALAQAFMPCRNIAVLLATPMLATAASAAYVAMTSNSDTAMLQAWYAQAVWSPATALPVYAASAGVAGVIFGSNLGWSFSHSENDAAKDE